MGKEQNRNNGLDLLRIISAFAVILIHTNAIFLFADTESSDKILVIENLINLIARFSVPVFVMISGTFLLGNDKNYDIGSFYKRSLIKIGIPYIGIFLFWVVYSLVKLLQNKIDFQSFVQSVISMSDGNLWFMPMIIGLYLLTPFLNRIIKSVTSCQIRIISIFIIVWAVVSQRFSSLSLPYSMGVVFAYLGYFLLGYTLKEVKINKRFVTFGGVYSLLC